MFSYPHRAQGPPFFPHDHQAGVEGCGLGVLVPFSCNEIQGDSEGRAQKAGRDMPIAQRRGVCCPPGSLGVARSLRPCARGCASAHFQTPLLKELNWGIAFSSLSRCRSFAV